jgi:hypothetical protein
MTLSTKIFHSMTPLTQTEIDTAATQYVEECVAPIAESLARRVNSHLPASIRVTVEPLVSPCFYDQQKSKYGAHVQLRATARIVDGYEAVEGIQQFEQFGMMALASLIVEGINSSVSAFVPVAVEEIQ